MTQLYREISLNAASSRSMDSRTTMDSPARIVFAPSTASRFMIRPPTLSVPVTPTVIPVSAPGTMDVKWNAQTSPTAMIPGGVSPAFLTASGRSFNDARTTRILDSVPSVTTAAGVSPSFPPFISRFTISSRLERPMRKISVPGSFA